MEWSLPDWAQGVNWYGLCMATGYASTYLALRWNERDYIRKHSINIERLAIALTVSAFVGARFGYYLLYRLDVFLHDPSIIANVNRGGMSFFGGFIAMTATLYIYSAFAKVNFLGILDKIGMYAPIGLGIGRIGNFLNSELYGRQTDLPFGIIFINVDNVTRHPTQLYEAILQGPVLFFTLNYASKVRIFRESGAISGLFFVLYATSRLLIEPIREPIDGAVSYSWGSLTPGQHYALIMLGVGLVILTNAVLKRRR